MSDLKMPVHERVITASPELIRVLIEQDEVMLWKLGKEPPIDPEDPDGTRWHAHRARLMAQLEGYWKRLA